MPETAAEFDPYALCPCNSGNKAKFCCLKGKQWNKNPISLKPAELVSNFFHQRCYAKSTGNCSTKISKEHFISHNILKGFEHNNKVKIIGLPWQEVRTFDRFPIGSLASNILCTTHNRLLSPFDSEMGRLHKTIIEYDDDFNESVPVNQVSVFCGEDLERWMLKTCCALIASNQVLVNGERANLSVNQKYIDILYNDIPFPEHWGMYFRIPGNKQIQSYHTISIKPFVIDGDLKAAEFLINNFAFYLVLGELDRSTLGIFRPRGIQMVQDGINKVIEICWVDKKYNEGIFLQRVGTRVGHPPEWEEYLKK